MNSVERVLEYSRIPSEGARHAASLPQGWPAHGEVVFRDCEARYRPGSARALCDVRGGAQLARATWGGWRLAFFESCLPIRTRTKRIQVRRRRPVGKVSHLPDSSRWENAQALCRWPRWEESREARQLVSPRRLSDDYLVAHLS